MKVVGTPGGVMGAWRGALGLALVRTGFQRDRTYTAAHVDAILQDNAALRSTLEGYRSREEQLTFQAFHDSLTKLANRALFTDRLEHALAARRRDPKGMAVLFLDLDDFKRVNDSLGHAAGDELLAALGRRLQSCVRPGDTAARLGGDEFAVLAEDAATIEGAVGLADRIIDSLRKPFKVHGELISMHASIGVAWSASSNDDADVLLRNADTAMYRAKREGKNRCAFFTSNEQASSVA